MVIKITSPHSFRRALNYNEQKVKQSDATFLFAGNFLQDGCCLSFQQKLARFTQLMLLNERTKKSHSLHISLNFHPSEYLREDQLIRLATAYMGKIGFENQPFLVYKHTDAAHPHIHILTTNIQPDGSRIDTYNIGRNQSEKARQALEAEFGLIKASGRNFKTAHLSIASVDVATYGKDETKKGIERILGRVLREYQFTSLPALNALLGLFRLRADPGNPGSRLEKFKGLRYQMLDAAGKSVGVPIKASALSGKPTLETLGQYFRKNTLLKATGISKLRHKLNQILKTDVNNFESARARLLDHQTVLVLRQNEQGRIYGLTFVDHSLKSVFNGSEIGKNFSAAAFQERFPLIASKNLQTFEPAMQKVIQTAQSMEFQSSSLPKLPDLKLWHGLTHPEGIRNNLPFELTAKKRKRKRKLNG